MPSDWRRGRAPRTVDGAMSDAEQFDAYYAESRDRLLVQAFALTGDLPASRGAVRDSFIAAWHHWSKIKRIDDPETWVRPHVWSHAQRRHTARIWHRDRKLDPEVRATLDALAKLPVVPRKTLLLTQLTSSSRQEMAQEVGLPLDDAEERLQSATSQFALQRQVSTTWVRPLLEQLADHCRDQRWPRATIIRRAGTTRRRTHAVAGAGLVVATLVGSGFLVSDGHGVHPTLAAAGDRLDSVPANGTGEEPSPRELRITPASLVSKAQLDRAVPGRSWRITGTDPKQGMTFPCQRRAYADPKAPTALVRNFTARHQKGKAQLAVVQTMELSSDETAARSGFAAATKWFSACTVPRMQLVGVRRIQHLGDDAQQYILRSWSPPTATFVLGVARTGRINTLTLSRSSGAGDPDLAGNVRLLVTAVDDLCATTLGGRCSALPQAVDMPAPPAGTLPMMLSEFDLPPAAGVDRPWVGTTPKQATQNVAATGCDRSSFQGPGWTHAATRSFLVPDGPLAASFGITETVGRLPPAKATAFISGIRAKLASCPGRELGTKVLRLANGPTWSAWRVQTQVTQKQTVVFYMGVVRSGGAVAQVGFVPDGTHSLTTAQFVALVRRASERLDAMP
jgi:DNA-directed RNA polymerase specialized sigma24 family protein